MSPRGKHRPSLSRRSVRVLEALEGLGVAGDAGEPALVAAAGSERQVFGSLATLAGKGLVWWSEGGRRIKISPAGRRLLKIERRRLVAPR